MALGTFIAGAYTATWGGLLLGITDDGFDLQWEHKTQTIEKSDVFGDMLIDGVYRGTNWFVQTEFMEFIVGAQSAAYPWAALGIQGIVGRLMSDVAGALVLTSTAGTPAVASPATLTANKSILAPGFNPNAVFSSRLRTMPCRMVLFPTVISTVLRNFVTT